MKSKREASDKSRDTRATYAPVIWPSMGLNNAVIVVGGCDGSRMWVEDVESDIWEDGGVASGSVVNRMPVETEDTLINKSPGSAS